MKKGGGDIIQSAPSVAKLDDMVGNKKRASMNYEFPDNNDNEVDSDKVSRFRAFLKCPLFFALKPSSVLPNSDDTLFSHKKIFLNTKHSFILIFSNW